MLSELGRNIKSFIRNVNPDDNYSMKAYHMQLDLLEKNKPLAFRNRGLANIEKNGKKSFRWGLGPASTIIFSLLRKQDIVLKISFLSPFVGQSITVKHNGVVLAKLIEPGIEKEVAMHGTEQNHLILEYSHWDKPPKLFTDDPRPVAAQFYTLAIAFTDEEPFSFPGKNVSFPYIGSPKENEELARKEYAEGKTILSSLPPVVTLGLTSFCNNKIPCVICDRNTRITAGDSHINHDVLERANPLIRTASYLILHSGGEPLLPKYFNEIVEMVRPPTRITFATNAMLLTAIRADLMLSRDIMAAFTVSMDAATPEIYRIMRPSCNFETVKRNVAYYTRQAKKLGREKSKIFLNMTLCETNVEDVPALVDLANELGASLVEYNPLNPGLTHVVERVDGKEWNYLHESQFKDPIRHDELILEAWDRANKTGIKMVVNGKPFIGPDAEKLKEIAQSMKVTPFLEEGEVEWKSAFHTSFHPSLPPCYKPWQEVMIQPTGEVRLCCYYEMRFAISNIKDYDFFQIWNSEEMVAERKHFLSKGVSPVCHAIEPCMRCMPQDK